MCRGRQERGHTLGDSLVRPGVGLPSPMRQPGPSSPIWAPRVCFPSVGWQTDVLRAKPRPWQTVGDAQLRSPPSGSRLLRALHHRRAPMNPPQTKKNGYLSSSPGLRTSFTEQRKRLVLSNSTSGTCRRGRSRVREQPGFVRSLPQHPISLPQASQIKTNQ